MSGDRISVRLITDVLLQLHLAPTTGSLAAEPSGADPTCPAKATVDAMALHCATLESLAMAALWAQYARNHRMQRASHVFPSPAASDTSAATLPTATTSSMSAAGTPATPGASSIISVRFAQNPLRDAAVAAARHGCRLNCCCRHCCRCRVYTPVRITKRPGFDRCCDADGANAALDRGC